MVRRFISTVALVACAGIYAFAAGERATFILTDGQRKSGEVVFHGGERNNFIDNQLNLGEGGKEESFHIERVAVIDFAGGTPNTDELGKVGASGQWVALRNGSVESGKFVNMVGGDTLLWQNDAGQTRQIALRDVARVYLNPQSARTAFNYTGPTATPVGTSGTASTLEPGAARVEATQAWTDTGITVKTGDLVAFRATGQIAFGQSAGQTASPDGKGDVRSPNYPVSAMPAGGLIARIGTSAPFPIGSNTQPIRMGSNGRLFLGINDNELTDNSGFFSVVVTKTGQSR
jgi:hypothetical protein